MASRHRVITDPPPAGGRDQRRNALLLALIFLALASGLEVLALLLDNGQLTDAAVAAGSVGLGALLGRALLHVPRDRRNRQ